METLTVTKKLDRIERQLRATYSELTRTRYKLRQPNEELDARARWVALSGIWKGKFKEDPVKWQQRIRKEWDRRS